MPPSAPPRSFRSDGQLTIAEALRQTRSALTEAGIPEPGLEAELLVREAARMDAARLFANLNALLPVDGVGTLQAHVARRVCREPLPYILGRREFYGRTFEVDARVLIPRPETELLVDRAVAFLRRGAGHLGGSSTRQTPRRLADVGTGSGILAATLASEIMDLAVDAVDISPEALAVAAHNAERLGVAEQASFFQGDLYEPLVGRYDVILSNPPYIATALLDRAQPELSHEPRVALAGGCDGTSVVSRLIREASPYLKPDAFLLLIEIDPPIADMSRSAAIQQFPSATVRLLEDGAGLQRCLEVRAG